MSRRTSVRRRAAVPGGRASLGRARHGLFAVEVVAARGPAGGRGQALFAVIVHPLADVWRSGGTGFFAIVVRAGAAAGLAKRRDRRAKPVQAAGARRATSGFDDRREENRDGDRGRDFAGHEGHGCFSAGAAEGPGGLECGVTSGKGTAESSTVSGAGGAAGSVGTIPNAGGGSSRICQPPPSAR